MENQASKPSRSEELSSLEIQEQMEQNVKEQFDAAAPKRHTKPQRSEYSSQYTDKLFPQGSGLQIPEYTKFQELESHKDELIYTGDSPAEEFIETDYYKDLNDIDKEHHTTGTGFIKVGRKSDSDFHLGSVSNGSFQHTTTNPATNEWVPSAEQALPNSNKPKRSDLEM
ncbi:hypothetical protein SUGI_1066420 [Cryptomeria japonica]|uniref:uncharacterized protein LOC131029986 n=1 Tax=Cryptomeria japonica TaxID=3369 RepID=UPI0024147429|nr:uncharacterized protein LOC131029986 [Cryptomeria japonica]GLJ50122.1 hypothetical protein SUGI_1066420 [Cryptomeria japonica]